MFSRDVRENKGYRTVGEKQCHSVNKCILFEIILMQSVNRRIIYKLLFCSMLQNESAEGKKEPLFAESFDFTVRLVQLELRGTSTVSSLLARRI